MSNLKLEIYDKEIELAILSKFRSVYIDHHLTVGYCQHIVKVYWCTTTIQDLPGTIGVVLLYTNVMQFWTKCCCPISL